MKRTITITAVTLLASLAGAQSAMGDWIVAGSPDATSGTGGGLFVVDAAKGTATAMQNVTGDLKQATAIIPDPLVPNVWYVGTSGELKGVPGPANIYKVQMAAGRVLNSTKLNKDTMTSDVEIYSMYLRGDELVFGTRKRLATLSTQGGNSQTLMQFTGNYDQVHFAFDGRWIYGAFYDNGGWRTGGGTVRRIDSQNPTKAEMWINVDQFPTNVRDLFLDSQGRLVTFDKGNFGSPTMRVWDVHTKKQIGSNLIMPFMSLTSPMRAAIDLADDTIVVTGQGVSFTDPRYAICTVQNGKIVQSMFSPVAHALNGVGVRRSAGLMRRGYECDSTTMAWTGAVGAAMPGNTNYALTLTATQGTPALLILGGYNSTKNPLQLFGTKCELGIGFTPFFEVLTGVVPASGTLSVPLPLPSNYRGLSIDSQWALLDAKANNAGLVTTQVGAILVR